MNDTDRRQCQGFGVPTGQRIYYQSLGCKVNSYETDALRTLFESRGFTTTNDPGQCDVYVINTCTVTAEADRKSGQMIRRAGRTAPGAIVVAMGCRTQMRNSGDGADIWIGTSDRASLVDRVICRLSSSDRVPNALVNDTTLPENHVITTGSSEMCRDYEEFGAVISREGTRAFVKIQDGCDNFCSYCIIPFARGRARSRNKAAILDEIRKLGNSGYSEIVLTGINLNAYGKDLEGAGESFEQLLTEIEAIESVRRIRLGSIEPNMITDRLVHVLSGMTKFCGHLHLSLQSGSDTVLDRMNRKYKTAEFAGAVDRLKRALPEISITTDIIVGFPAETDAEHRESLAFCEKIGFSKIHVFPYSVRAGAAAARMRPQVDPDTKKKRKNDFLKLSDTLFARAADFMTGKTVSVLVEKNLGNGCFSGYSREYYRVRFTTPDKVRTGQEVPVRILGSEKELLFGEIITKDFAYPT